MDADIDIDADVGVDVVETDADADSRGEKYEKWFTRLFNPRYDVDDSIHSICRP